MNIQIDNEVLRSLLIATYFIYLAAQTKFRPYWGISTVAFFWGVLYVLLPASYGLRLAIMAIPILVVLIYGIVAVEKWVQNGKRYLPDGKDLVVALIFGGIYAVVNMII